MKNKLELRMYGLVNYQLSGIQKGIQFGHSVVRYKQKIDKKYLEDKELFKDLYNQYNDWANNYETFIILNGGTTNKERGVEDIYKGTLNNYSNTLKENNVYVSEFFEPDLGNQLTAVCFIVDERVFDRVNYLDYEDWLETIGKSDLLDRERNDDNVFYKQWTNIIGGGQNSFLRDFLKDFRLA